MKRGNDRDGRRAVFVMEQLEGRALMSAGGIYALSAVIQSRSDGFGSSQDIASHPIEITTHETPQARQLRLPPLGDQRCRVPGERAEAYTGLRRSDFTDNALNLCVRLASQVSRVERIGANEELIEHYAE